MKKIFMAMMLTLAFACHNPEDKATMPNDSTAGYNESNVTNSPPGVNSPDTLGSPEMDSSKVDQKQ